MKKRLRRVLILTVLFPLPLVAQVLVMVGEKAVTSGQLEKALRSAPFASQFPTLDEVEQARLRGDMLERLVNFELLLQEAERLRLDQSPGFQQELTQFESGLLVQRYLQKMREGIEVPEELQRQWEEKFSPDLDAVAAARSLYIARHYEQAKTTTLARLKDVYGQDLSDEALWVRGARDEGVKVDGQVDGYRRELMVQRLLDQKVREWIPTDRVLRDYYQSHPEIGRVPERWHVGQIVVESRELAESLRKGILNGESLFKLAAEYTVDPYGRDHAGDMGWLKAGEGMPQLEKALSALPDNQVSEVIETPKGFHLVMIVDRRPGDQKSFAAIKDRVRRAFLAERLPPYLKSLQQRYPLKWELARRSD